MTLRDFIEAYAPGENLSTAIELMHDNGGFDYYSTAQDMYDALIPHLDDELAYDEYANGDIDYDINVKVGHEAFSIVSLYRVEDWGKI